MPLSWLRSLPCGDTFWYVFLLTNCLISMVQVFELIRNWNSRPFDTTEEDVSQRTDPKWLYRAFIRPSN